jgi:hypothetical protein
MPTVLQEAGGFTPIIDVLVDEIGLIGASIFGRVWRYCQGKRRVCQASIDTLASGLGISGRTVQRHLRALCEAGYLEDLTPDLKNRPHTYRDTGKAMSVQSGATESHTKQGDGTTESQGTMTESHSHHDRESGYHDRKSHEDTPQDTDKTQGKILLPKTPGTEWLFQEILNDVRQHNELVGQNGGRKRRAARKFKSERQQREVEIAEARLGLEEFKRAANYYLVQGHTGLGRICAGIVGWHGSDRTRPKPPHPSPKVPDYDAMVDPKTGYY